MTEQFLSPFKWDPYMMRTGTAVQEFWSEFCKLRKRHVLFILGRGFDPRMPIGLQGLVGALNGSEIDVMQIHVERNSQGDSMLEDLAKKNSDVVERLVKSRGSVLHRTVSMWSPDRRRIGSRDAANLFANAESLSKYTDIIVDISALPRSVYFSVLGKLYYLFDAASQQPDCTIPNLHVSVAESPELDRLIRVTGVDENGQYLHGFVADLELEASSDVPKLWIPILGEMETPQLERLHALVNPSEICPMVPAPAKNPRRADDLFTEYRTLLLDDWLVEPKNILYANERNPFEAYRQIHQTVRYYDESLQPLRGCRTIISALSSKLLSLAALLAACELNQRGFRVALADVPAQGYEVDSGIEGVKDAELFFVSLLGECYDG